MQWRAESLRRAGHHVDFLPAWRELDWQQYDVAHLFMANGDSFALAQAIQAHLPLVLSPIIDRTQTDLVLRVATWSERCLPGFYSHLGRCAALCVEADLVCLRSLEEERRLVRGLGVNGRRIVAPCGLPKPVAAVRDARWDDLTDRPYVLFVGDAGNPRKNVARLIQAVSGLKTTLLVAGVMSPGSTARRVKLLIADNPRVHWLGPIEEPVKTDLMRRAAVFALPSLMEGIGLAAMEAAWHGTTVVTTPRGGATDYLGDDAYYVCPQSVGDIRRQLDRALRHRRDASPRLRERFNLTACGRQLAAGYANIVAPRPAAVRPAA
jgi:glycosyltransferase involved in cell wall biosynthesis